MCGGREKPSSRWAGVNATTVLEGSRGSDSRRSSHQGWGNRRRKQRGVVEHPALQEMVTLQVRPARAPPLHSSPTLSPRRLPNLPASLTLIVAGEARAALASNGAACVHSAWPHHLDF